MFYYSHVLFAVQKFQMATSYLSFTDRLQIRKTMMFALFAKLFEFTRVAVRTVAVRMSPYLT